MAFVAGYEGTVTASSTDLNISSWSGDLHCDLPEVTNTGGAGWQEFVAGTKGMTGRVMAHWDDNNEPLPALFPGELVTLVLKVGNSPDTIGCSALIENMNIKSEVKGTADYEFTFKATGAITSPT